MFRPGALGSMCPLLCQGSTSEYSSGGVGQVREGPRGTSTKMQSFSHSLNTRSLASAPSALGQAVQVGDEPALGPRALTAAVARRHTYNGHRHQGDGQRPTEADMPGSGGG